MPIDTGMKNRQAHIEILEASLLRKIERLNLNLTHVKLAENILRSVLHINKLKEQKTKKVKIKKQYIPSEEELQARQDKLALIDYLDDGTLPWED